MIAKPSVLRLTALGDSQHWPRCGTAHLGVSRRFTGESGLSSLVLAAARQHFAWPSDFHSRSSGTETHGPQRRFLARMGNLPSRSHLLAALHQTPVRALGTLVNRAAPSSSVRDGM